MTHRLTQYAHGGGCACKIPPGELEDVVRGLTAVAPRDPAGELLVGLDSGDDAAVVRIEGGTALIATTDFFTPVVDDAYDWGRIAATNALSDVYAMGGRPVVAVNLLGWPRDVLPFELAAETLRGGLDVCALAGCHLAGGHSVDDPEPKYGLAVTGIADPNRLLRNDSGKPGTPLSLTKPLGLGVLNNRHKATGERFEEAVAVMTTLNAEAASTALAAGAECATDVTGFGLLGHLHKLARASGVTAVIDSAAVRPWTTKRTTSSKSSSRPRAPFRSRIKLAFDTPPRFPVWEPPSGAAAPPNHCRTWPTPIASSSRAPTWPSAIRWGSSGWRRPGPVARG